MRTITVALAACAVMTALGGAGAQTADPLAAKLRQGLTPEETQQIVAVHNAARAAITEASPALVPVTWNATLATQAQAYADKLAAGTATGHDETRHAGWNMGIGENLASVLSDHLGTANELATAWVKERDANFRYAPFPASNIDTRQPGGGGFEGSGHYLTMVWDWTRQIGCGAASKLATHDGRPVIERILVCRYARGGNALGQYPYYTAANKPAKMPDPIVTPAWLSAADAAAARERVANADFQPAMLAFMNGHRGPAKVTWDATLAAEAQAAAVARTKLPLGQVGNGLYAGQFLSYIAADATDEGLYPHVTDAFAKTISWNPPMSGWIRDGSFTKLGCGTTTNDWGSARYRVTFCQFK